MSNRIRYTLDEVQRNTFYQLPKFLFEGEFAKLGNDARVLYSMLRDRHELSIKNKWVNNIGEVYLIFSRENMREILGLSENTILKSMNALKKFNLIEEERQGLGRANKIYLLSVENLDNSKNLKYCGSGTADIAGLNQQNLRANDTEFIETHVESNLISSNRFYDNETKKIKTDTIRADETYAQQNGSVNEKPEKKENLPAANTNHGIKHTGKQLKTNINPDYDKVKEIISENIDYDTLVFDYPTRQEDIDEILSIITSTICADFKDGYISMGQERMPAEAVKSVFYKLDMFDIQYFFESYDRANRIGLPTPYIRTALYRNKSNINHYYANRVQTDRKKRLHQNE
jgi:cell fate (sporulation/competence/biofilm development) regulator YmcA (YheA/YmcA/DUF963 family)